VLNWSGKPLSMDYRKINKQLMKIYFFLLVLVQFIGIYIFIFYVEKNILTVIFFGLLLGVLWPVLLGLALIKYFSKKVRGQS